MPHGFGPSPSLTPAGGTAGSSVPRQAVTANRLRDGAPVYFVGEGRWSPSIDDAAHVPAEAAENLLVEAQASPAPLPVVAPYLIDAVFEDGELRPVSLRERIRAFGPTVGSARAQAK